MKVKISVTADDIARGVRGLCDSCPIALAMKRLLPDSDIDVENEFVSINQRDVSLPAEARDFVGAFDLSDEEFEECWPVPGPFEFDLDIPDEMFPVVTP
jgi:hypothetical protein